MFDREISIIKVHQLETRPSQYADAVKKLTEALNIRFTCTVHFLRIRLYGYQNKKTKQFPDNCRKSHVLNMINFIQIRSASVSNYNKKMSDVLLSLAHHQLLQFSFTIQNFKRLNSIAAKTFIVAYILHLHLLLNEAIVILQKQNEVE